ncbi:MAG TPA: hypothetical protein DCR70_11800, partial [Phycisphaerales bacterium]|nr:hypothetical protein [Phycisphaerales bacterium]
MITLAACLFLASHAQVAQATAPQAVPSLSAGDQARRALQVSVVPSIVTVTSYQRVPEGVPHEGRWAVADESPYPGMARATVSSGIFVGT